MFLAKKFCCDKITSVATKDPFCHDKNVCHNTFVTTYTFVATKHLLLVGAWPCLSHMWWVWLVGVWPCLSLMWWVWLVGVWPCLSLMPSATCSLAHSNCRQSFIHSRHRHCKTLTWFYDNFWTIMAKQTAWNIVMCDKLISWVLQCLTINGWLDSKHQLTNS